VWESASGTGIFVLSRGGRESRDFQNLLLVEALPLRQGPGQPVEFSAMFREEPPSLLVALTNDP
jgi:hypothetical protein